MPGGVLQLKLMCLFITGICVISNAETTSIQVEMNKYYENMDESFSRICKSSALKSTGLSAAEKLFVKELRKNLSYYILVRTNSKGKIISEAVRGKKVERPNTSAEREKWFQVVKKTKEPYYTLIRDDDRGRYYLIWSKPVLKNNVFVGAVTAKIDLWDSFYEFSNSVYYPFLIRLNGLRLFSHKWNNDFTHKEERLSIPGVNRISVRFIPEKKADSAVTTVDSSMVPTEATVQQDSVIPETVSIDTNKLDTVSTFSVENSDKSAADPKNVLIIIILSVAVLACGTIVTFIIISRNRKKAFLKELDSE